MMLSGPPGLVGMVLVGGLVVPLVGVVVRAVRAAVLVVVGVLRALPVGMQVFVFVQMVVTVRMRVLVAVLADARVFVLVLVFVLMLVGMDVLMFVVTFHGSLLFSYIIGRPWTL